MRFNKLVLVLAAAIFIAGCGDGTAATTTTETTTSTQPQTSEEVAQAFFTAWTSNDQEAMGAISEPDALAEATALEVRATEAWAFQQCEGAAGTIYCSWQFGPGILTIGVRNIQEPHVVTSFRMIMA